jgi:hypothetical protein
MRGRAVAVVAAAALVACATGSAQSADTELRVTYWANGLGQGEPTRWTLACNPARGTLPRPALACARLAERGARLFRPVPRDAICTQIYGGPQVGRVVGSVEGKRVWTTFNRVNGCQIARWNRVAPWLLPRAGTST